MLADKDTVREAIAELYAFRERHSERSDVIAEGIIGQDCLCDQLRVLRLHAIVNVLSPVAEGPAIEGTLLHRGQIIRHQVTAELVALIDNGPQLAGLRLPTHPVRIAQAGSEHA